jgi:hypothetical protein
MGGMQCETNISTKNIAFERSSKGYPSEGTVKRGHRVVRGEKELAAKTRTERLMST